MKIRNIRSTILGSAIALAAGTAFAQQAPNPEELLSQFDQDENQSLSLAEFQDLYRDQAGPQQQNDLPQQATEKFEMADSDNNDELAMSELRRILPINTEESQNSVAASQSHSPQSHSSQADSDAADQRAISAGGQVELSTANRGIADANQSDTSQQDRSQTDRTTQRYERSDAQSDRALTQSEQRGSTNSEATLSASLEMKARQQPEELEGKDVQNSQEEELGEIEQIVRHTATGDLYVVVSNGGFAGFGADLAVIPVTELQEQQDMIVFTGANSELQEYEESQYEEVTAETAQNETEEEREEERQRQIARQNTPR